MSVGHQTDKGTIDATVGNLGRQIEIWTSRVPDFKAWLDTIPSEDLQLPPYNYTADDVALLRSAVNDMYTLSQVYLGNEELTPARDLSVFVGRVAGLPLSAV